jgi:inner membrane protein
MASAPSHAAFALALGAWLAPKQSPRAALVVVAALAVLPDIDAVGYWLGIPTASVIGHRGVTHSIAFAVAVGLSAAWLFARRKAISPGRVAPYFVIAMLSHGVLDAFTNGGPGIAFFAPFSNSRYFFPFRPIAVSPIGVQGVLGERGLRILVSEGRWILLPAALLAASALLLRWRRPVSPR